MKKLPLLWAGLVLVLSSVGWGQSLSQLNASVRLRIRDTTLDATNQQFTDAQITQVLNEAQRNVINATWVLTNTTSFQLLSGQREYVMPSDFISPLRVIISSVPIVETTLQSLDASGNTETNPTYYGGGTQWETTTSTPTAYYMERDFNSNVIMGFYALPSTTSAPGQVKVYYAQQVTNLVNPTDLPFNGRTDLLQYADLLVDYAAATLWQAQAVMDYANSYWALYTARLKLMNDDVGKMPNYNPSFSGFRGPRQ